MAITIPTEITTPLLTCFTTVVYATIALGAIDSVAGLILTLTAAVKNTEWQSVILIIPYIVSMLAIADMVKEILKSVIYKDYLTKKDDDPMSRIESIQETTSSGGLKLRVVQFSNNEPQLIMLRRRGAPTTPTLFNSQPVQAQQPTGVANSGSDPAETAPAAEQTKKPESDSNNAAAHSDSDADVPKQGDEIPTPIPSGPPIPGQVQHEGAEI